MEHMIKIWPLYVFPSLAYFAEIKEHERVYLSIGERYHKQTPRNRFEISGPNNVQVLSLPVVHPGNRACMADVVLDYREKWNLKHLRSIETCYRKAAFFEFYFPYFEHLFTNKYHLLTEFNLEALHIAKRCLKLNTRFEISTEAMPTIELDLNPAPKSYFQVFEERSGFKENLCILDLIFNEGPNALEYI